MSIDKILIFTAISLTFFSFTLAQNSPESNPPGAREVILKFVELNNKQSLQTPEARLMFINSALKWKMVWFGEISAPPDKIAVVEKNFSVARVQTVQKNSRVVDLYFYLRFEAGGWRLSSMRSMAQTGWLEAAVETFKNKPALVPEMNEVLANAELTLSSDKMLTEWFQTNRLALDKLAVLALIETKPKPEKVVPTPKIKMRRADKKQGISYGVVAADPLQKDDLQNYESQTIERITENTKIFPKSAAALKNLHFTALETKKDGGIQFVIGGILDNSVGFIYSPKDAPPQIDGWRYIWVEKLAAHWYLFRTT